MTWIWDERCRADLGLKKFIAWTSHFKSLEVFAELKNTWLTVQPRSSSSQNSTSWNFRQPRQHRRQQFWIVRDAETAAEARIHVSLWLWRNYSTHSVSSWNDFHSLSVHWWWFHATTHLGFVKTTKSFKQISQITSHTVQILKRVREEKISVWAWRWNNFDLRDCIEEL